MSDLESLRTELSQVRHRLADRTLPWAEEDVLVRRAADLAEMISAEQRRVLEGLANAYARLAL